MVGFFNKKKKGRKTIRCDKGEPTHFHGATVPIHSDKPCQEMHFKSDVQTTLGVHVEAFGAEGFKAPAPMTNTVTFRWFAERR